MSESLFVEPLHFKCPYCSAAEGAGCLSLKGNPRLQYHAQRLELARKEWRRLNVGD